jgi:ParB family transcriptional regulator, chromosome partitioning protein
MATKKTQALGKGLEALLGNIKTDNIVNHKTNTITAEIAYIPLSQIETNPNQPRKEFSEDTLEELAQSIREHGVIVPITVNKSDDKYIIIAGERRYRAAKKAGLNKIPAYIRIVTEQETMEMALIENIQRDDLNSIEIALSLNALLQASSLSPEQLGKKIGKSRSTIANYIRLLALPAEIQLAIRNDEISMGHARALINVDSNEEQIRIVKEIISKNLSVRQVEAMVSKLKAPKQTTDKKKKQKTLPEFHNEFQKAFSKRLATPIEVKRSQRGKGMITIPFSNDKDFERIVALLENIE